MRELALHLLDIAENSVSAQAQNITISVEEKTSTNRLCMSVKDDGVGMTPEMAARVVDPFVTSRSTRKVGLGLPFLKQAAEDCNGFLQIHSAPVKGTLVEVEFQLDHIDRMPLGDLAGTFLSLLVANSAINWVFDYRADDNQFIFESAPIVKELEDVPLSEPTVLAFLREQLQTGLAEVSEP